jgi:NifU-like protein involved in Fe-S cluster formation
VNYSAVLLDHFRNPRNGGLMRDPDAVGEGEYEGCGDLARVYLKVRDGRAVDVRVQTYGCGPTIAAASAGSELAMGRPLSDLTDLAPGDVERALDGLPEERKHAADVVAAAIRSAAQGYLARVPKVGEAQPQASRALRQDGEAQPQASRALRQDGEAQPQVSRALRQDGEAQPQVSRALRQDGEAQPTASRALRQERRDV